MSAAAETIFPVKPAGAAAGQGSQAAAPAHPALSPAVNIKRAVAKENSTAGSVIETLDSYGFDVGQTHISLWTGSVVLLVIVGVIVFARLGSQAARWLLGKTARLDLTQKLLAEKLATVFIWALALLIGIDILGINLTALAVFSGAFGLAIGFGLQKTFGNLIAGIILLMDRSIKPGDVISVADVSGKDSFGQIRKIGIRAISVVTRDKTEYLIPNEILMTTQVVNWSYSSRDVRVKAPVGVAYDTDLELAERLMLQAAGDTPRVLANPEPKVLLMAFGESSVQFEIRFWIMDPEEGVSGVRSEVYKRVWKLFHEHGVSLPFPQRDLNLQGEQFDRLIAALSGGEPQPTEP
ncbi:MAG TPA: mechanosensitive ion channel domain-containing protein [Sphingomonadaceae bacterium]